LPRVHKENNCAKLHQQEGQNHVIFYKQTLLNDDKEGRRVGQKFPTRFLIRKTEATKGLGGRIFIETRCDDSERTC